MKGNSISKESLKVKMLRKCCEIHHKSGQELKVMPTFLSLLLFCLFAHSDKVVASGFWR